VQAPKYHAVSLFSGVLGLELGLAGSRPQWGQHWFTAFFGAQASSRFVEPLCFVLSSVFCDSLRIAIFVEHVRKSFQETFCQTISVHHSLQVEKDPFCREVISARVQEGHFGSKSIPCFEDVEKFKLSDLEPGAEIDALAGGFPCQAGYVFIYNSNICLYFGLAGRTAAKQEGNRA